MKEIRFEGVCKKYGTESVLDNLNLQIPAGKFFALLGPSGCGKTTLLRLLAGLEKVDAGKIFLGDEEITDMPIYRRKINTVFQHYALFPHLSVFENVAYSLRVRSFSTSDVKEKVLKALKMMRLDHMASKDIASLSGGQKQRVALARAIASEPEVLLLDEPLAAIDFSLKEQLLIELSDLQEKLNTTFVYVTHDQFEALTIADTIAIMNKHGVIEQAGKPRQIYEFPVSRFVASFVGKTNMLEGVLHVDRDEAEVLVEGLGSFKVHTTGENSRASSKGHVFMSIRPEKIDISKEKLSNFSNVISGTVKDIIYYGQSTQYRVRVGSNHLLTVFEQNEEHFPQARIDYDDVVQLHFQKENVVLLEH
jgi:spermidine/putrescine transport system ATP-binding protein